MFRCLLGHAVVLVCFWTSATAHAQACCAGATAITPGRLELHEKALVGLQLRASGALGYYSSTGVFKATPKGAAEVDFRQDFLGSVRWLGRGQASVLVPVHESWRRSSTTGAEFGGGLGDLNFGLRYDLIRNREYSYLPGLAFLAGVTLPSGRAPERARQPLGSDVTGVGTAQFSAGLALERSFGDILVSATGLASKRMKRKVYGLESELGTQLTGILGVSYTLIQETAAALIVLYTQEGDARIAAHEVPGTASRQLRGVLAVSSSISERLRLQAGRFFDPPVDNLGQNQPAALGATLGLIWGFW